MGVQPTQRGQGQRTRLAFRRPSRSGVSPVVAEVLMIAVTLLLAAVLFVMLTGPASPPPETSTLVFSVNPLTQNANNASRNDTFVSIASKLGTGELFWTDPSLNIYVLDNNGTVMTAHNASFSDLNNNSKVDAGDRITIRSMTAAYHGLHLIVHYHNRIVGDIELP
jgi:flagellin-like protein